MAGGSNPLNKGSLPWRIRRRSPGRSPQTLALILDWCSADEAQVSKVVFPRKILEVTRKACQLGTHKDSSKFGKFGEFLGFRRRLTASSQKFQCARFGEYLVHRKETGAVLSVNAWK